MPSESSNTVHITVQCAKCQKRIRASAKYFGRRVPCPNCGATISVPKLSPETQTLPTSKSAPAVSSAPKQKPSGSVGLIAIVGTIVACAAIGVPVAIWAFGSGEPEIENSLAERESESSQPDESEVVSTEAAEGSRTMGDSVPETGDADGHYLTEVGFRFVFSADVEEAGKFRGQFSWRGTIVLSPQDNGDIQATTGVAIPNRWIVVPLQTVEAAEKIWVQHSGVSYEAEVRTKLEKLGFATLQIQRQGKFPPPFCELENRLKPDSKDLRLVYLDSAGNVVVSDGHNVKLKSSGYKYVFDGDNIPDQAIGGIVLQGLGRIAGLVAHRQFGGDVYCVPWSRIGSGWGKNAGKGIFDYDTPRQFKNQAEANDFHAGSLVQVLLSKKGKQASSAAAQLRSFAFDTHLKSNATVANRDFGDWQLLGDIANDSERNLEFFESVGDGLVARANVNPSQRRSGDDELVQLPFLMGAPVQWTCIRITDPSLDSWNSGKKFWANTRTGSSVRPEDKFQHPGESSFEAQDEYKVLDRGATRLKLQRKTEFVPSREYMRKDFAISGTEKIDVDISTGLVRNRTYQGTYAQRGADGEMHTARLFLSVEQMTEGSLKNTRVYWRK